MKKFYVNALSEPVFYNRLTGLFSSACLAVVAKGIAGLISSGGSMRLISGGQYQENEEVIIKAYRLGVERVLAK